MLVGRRITAMELDHRIFDQIGLPTELLTTPQLGVRDVRRSVLMTIGAVDLLRQFPGGAVTRRMTMEQDIEHEQHRRAERSPRPS